MSQDEFSPVPPTTGWKRNTAFTFPRFDSEDVQGVAPSEWSQVRVGSKASWGVAGMPARYPSFQSALFSEPACIDDFRMVSTTRDVVARSEISPDLILRTGLQALLGGKMAGQYYVVSTLIEQAVSTSLSHLRETLEVLVTERIAELESRRDAQVIQADEALRALLSGIQSRAAAIGVMPLESAVGYLNTADLFDDE